MKKGKILLVDDETEFVSTLAERLEMRHYGVAIAHDGESGLMALSEDLPEVVVLDLKMPGLSGIEVLRRVRKDHPHLPVILLTGYGSTRDGIQGMQLGAFGYLMKPIDIDVLVAKINEALQSSPGPAGAGP